MIEAPPQQPPQQPQQPRPSPADDAHASAPATQAAQAFTQRWRGITASEMSTAQSFFTELCEVLGVPRPAHEEHYMFERPITFQHGDGSTSPGRVDCYKRGHFVWESKKLKSGVAAQASAGSRKTSKAFDDALLKARTQAENYARALPAAEGRPPFVVVVDVGHVIELYAEFTRSGGTYTPFPDPRSHRIRLDELEDPAVRARLALLWTDPLSLDPSRASAKATRAVAAELALLAKSFEADGHAPQAVAAFLSRCLFSMFAEDVGLLPTVGAEGLGSFTHLLRQYREQPTTLVQMLRVFWQGMDSGGFNPAIAHDLKRFNGKIFKGAAAADYVLPLKPVQIDGLLRAAGANWKEVEPAIFGTLLERALDPAERHALGAHYTPRAYVERLVLPTVVEPLRADWANAQAAAVLLAREAEALEANRPQRKGGSTHDTFNPVQLAKDNRAQADHDRKVREKWEEARQEIRRFHHQLCTTRVLDPACGSGNFLYVTLEHLKRLEGEVLNQLREFGPVSEMLTEGETVTLRQLLGIEINARAAALAELVLWIGWLQWHVRTLGLAGVAEPVVHDYGNIENRDAVLAYDRVEPARDAEGKAITRWDGVTFKTHPVTGEQVPDEAAQVQQWAYVNPRPAEWPAAEFIVGNPPYLGARTSRAALGDGYLQALRSAHPEVPENADFVMYWWNSAATRIARGIVRSFGLITTNSLRQSFNRAVLEKHLGQSCDLTFCIPDHPWVDSSDGAAIRVALSAAQHPGAAGILESVVSESPQDDGGVMVDLSRKQGRITAGLTIGIDVAAAPPLLGNAGVCCVGYQLSGQGFVVDAKQAAAVDIGFDSSSAVARPLIGGRDLMQSPRGLYALDLYGHDERSLRITFPAAYQWVADRVRPERMQNARPALRNRWWVFGEARSTFRPALRGLSTCLVTSLTAKHRVFVPVPADWLCDSTTVMFAFDDLLYFGLLSSSVHLDWALAAGGTLEDRPRYIKSTCFENFPFPHEDTGLTPALTTRIRDLAEQLDAHRKARQAAHESVTLTGLYNVLDKLRRGEALTAKDKLLHEQGLVSVLQSLHDELDAAVLQAYGWADLGPVPWADETARAAWTETLLERLVALNARRAAEEAAGTVRWLRPDFQDPARRAAAARSEADSHAATAPTPQQAAIDGVESQAEAEERAAAKPSAHDGAEDGGDDTAPPAAAKPAATPIAQPWPPTLPEQVRSVAQLLSASPAPMPLAAIEAGFKGKGPWKKGLPRILETLEALGRAQQEAGGWRG